MSQDLSQYVGTKKAAALLGVDDSMIRRLLSSPDKRIKGMKFGHDWLVYVPSLEKYAATKSPKGRPPKNEPKLNAI